MGIGRYLTAVIVCLLTVGSASPAVAVNLIENGDFELGRFCPDFLTLPAGSPDLDDWTILTGDIDVVCNWQSYSGNRSLDLNGLRTGAIAQSFATVPGVTYELTFALAGNPGAAPSVKRLLVTVGDRSEVFEFDNELATGGTGAFNMKWQLKTVGFVAQGPLTTLPFQSLTTESCFPGLDACAGPALDAVSVVEASNVPLTVAVGHVHLHPFGAATFVYLDGSFTLPDSSNGIEPLTDPVSVTLLAFQPGGSTPEPLLTETFSGLVEVLAGSVWVYVRDDRRMGFVLHKVDATSYRFFLPGDGTHPPVVYRHAGTTGTRRHRAALTVG